MKEITIINQHANNFGDEAAGIALIDELINEYNVKKINVVYVGKGILNYSNNKVNHSDISLKKIGIKKIILRILLSKVGINYRGDKNLDRLLSMFEKSECVFVSPAGADIGIYKGWASLLNLYLVDSCKKKIIFHLNTINKSDSLIFNVLADYILKKSKLYVREQDSLSYLKKKNLNAKFGIDTAFILKDSNSIDRELNSIVLIPTKLESWNIKFKGSNIDETIFDNLFNPLAEFAIENNFKISLLRHLPLESETKYLMSIKNILENKYNKLQINVLENVNNAFDYQEQIKKAKLVISMRYHGVVLAAKNKIPFVSISYENKMNEVSKYMGCEEQSVDVLTVDKQKLYALLNYTIDNENDIKKTIESNILKLRRTVENPVKENVEK